MGKIPSLDLQAVLLFKQPRVLVALSAAGAGCWPMLRLLSARTPRAFFEELSPTSQSPALTIARGYSSPGAGFGNLLNFLRFLSAFLAAC